MKTTVVTITPELAKTWLELNSSNRPLNRRHVLRLAKDMTQGRWKFNGDTICLNADKLIDGQHRLQAIVESGVPCQTLVVEGLPFDVFDTKDIGKLRSNGDTLAVRGYAQGNNIAAALCVVHRFLTNRMMQRVRLTNMDIEELLSKHPGIQQSVKFCGNTRKLAPKSTMAGCHYLFSRVDRNMADQYVEAIITGIGAGDKKTDPAYAVRDRLLKNLESKAKLPLDYLAAIMIKGWNALRQGRQIHQLKFAEGEQFPEIS